MKTKSILGLASPASPPWRDHFVKSPRHRLPESLPSQVLDYQTKECFIIALRRPIDLTSHAMKTLWHLMIALLLVTGSGFTGSSSKASAQDASQTAVGHWEGNITLPGTELAIRIDLDQEAGTWTGSIDIPVQGLQGFDLASIAISQRDISFKLPKIPGDPSFEGQLSLSSDAISGTFSQSGMSFPFQLRRTEAIQIPGSTPAKGIPGEGIVGIWQGSLQANVFQLRLLFTIEPKEDDFIGTLDSLDQNAKDIPLTDIVTEDQEITFQAKTVGGHYRGTLSSDGAEIEGTWTQSGTTFPLTIKRLSQAPKLNRPQDPQPPFPYQVEDVVFENPAADIKLAGTLTLPKTDQPGAAVVLISGSGPQDRDEAIMGHRPFLVIADYLTRHGIAVLRYDDRGVGKSEGRFSRAIVADFTTDALAAVDFLRSRPEVDATKIGLIGHSEGGVVAPQAAILSEHVAYIVLLAGVGVPLDELLPRQSADMLRIMGTDEETLEKQTSIQQEVFNLVRTANDTEDVEEKIIETLKKSVETFTPEELEALGWDESQLASQAKTVIRPWYRDLLEIVPANTLKYVKCPVLAVNGEKDIQVACYENLNAIEAALESGGNQDITTKAFPHLNHLFQTCQSGALSEYGTIQETFNPAVMETIKDWIQARTK